MAIDVPISLLKDYDDTWIGSATTIDTPFIEPEDPIRESFASPTPISHIVRVDQIWYDDEEWPMNEEQYAFPVGAAMAEGTQEPLDDYRLVFDGTHA